VEITEVRVKLVDSGQDKLRAFCSITIDDAFVVRDLKIIEGSKGLFVAMPSRKLMTRCSRCGYKNQVRSSYCNDCGVTLPPEDSQRLEGKGKLHADIAHPINTECREQLQARVVESYLEEVDVSQQPGYRPNDLEATETTESSRAPERSDEFPEEVRRPRSDARSESVSRTEPRARTEPEARPEPVARPERSPVLADQRFEEPVERPRPAAPRRPTARERGPLSEMPPPDDNFSAGIF
jgi:stage V sporulation protein G